jgi:hypothetical protein
VNSEALRSDEKLKATSGATLNLGAALFASGFGRWFFTGVDAWAVAWIIFGASIMLAGIQLLSFLIGEHAHG